MLILYHLTLLCIGLCANARTLSFGLFNFYKGLALMDVLYHLTGFLR